MGPGGLRVGQKVQGDKSYGKLKQEGLTDEQIAAHKSELIDPRNGKLISGWGGITKRILAEGAEAKAREDAAWMMGAMAQYGIKMAETNYEMSQKAAEENLKRYPRISELAQKETKSTADFLNEYMQERFYAMLDEVTPDWREKIRDVAMESHGDVTAISKRFTEEVLPGALDAVDEMSVQMLDIVNAQLRGELNPDVAASLKRHAAELSQQIGVRGQAAQYLTARDLGKTSMELQQQGIANAPAVTAFQSTAYGQMANVAQMPIQSGINLTNLMSAYRAPMTDIQQLFGAHLSGTAGTGIIPAGQIMQTGAQVMLGASGQAQSAIESMYGYNAQMMMNQQAMQLQDDLLRMQKKQNRWDNAMGLLDTGMNMVQVAALL